LWYSRGSAFDRDNAKSRKRKLLTNDEYEFLKSKLLYYFKLLNPYIKSIGNKPGKHRINDL
jgi:hypothetical protein